MTCGLVDAGLSRRALIAASVALPLSAARAAAQGEAPFEVHMRRANPASDPLTVALTFDACPGAFDWRIARALAENSIAATIFVTGRWLRRNPEALAFLAAHRDLFALENHGYWHIPPVLGRRRVFGIAAAGDVATVEREATAGAHAVRTAWATEPSWYRGATGFYSRSALVAILRLGYGVAGYSLNADMGATLPARAVAGRIADAVDGSVIVAHINQPHRSSGAGVAAGALALQARGVRFLRLDQMAPAQFRYF